MLGATSFVGGCVLRLLGQAEKKVVAYSRKLYDQEDEYIEWRRIDSHSSSIHKREEIRHWVCLAPIWVLLDYLELLESSEAKKVVVLSSTSRYTKEKSSDLTEQIIVKRLIDAEAQFQAWAENKGIDWIILRPTMIYGLGQDKNISEIARLIHRWGVFPLLGKGKGLRQPVHAEDVAGACYKALMLPEVKNGAYNLSGGEGLPYKEMVRRIFMAMNKKPRFIHLPHLVFLLVATLLHVIPRFRHVTVSMADRMNSDLIFDHSDAKAAFGFSPRSFNISAKDLPECCRE